MAFTVEADLFLHHMVRFIVGTMVTSLSAGAPPADFPVCLQRRITWRPVACPPQGLYLEAVRFLRNLYAERVYNMKFFLDTASLKDISWAAQAG